MVNFVFQRGPLVWKDGVNVAPGLDVAEECCRSGKVTFAFVPSIASIYPSKYICLLHSNFEAFVFQRGALFWNSGVYANPKKKIMAASGAALGTRKWRC